MKAFILSVALMAGLTVSAQRVNQCGIIIPPQRPNTSFSSVYEARDYVNTMLDSINWKENFTIREQNGINNAYATIIRGQRYIVYDNNFLENLDAYARTKWASISVLAHEMGHHYRNHVVSTSGSTPATSSRVSASPNGGSATSSSRPARRRSLRSRRKPWPRGRPSER